MHPSLFEDSCARAARTFGRKGDVNVVFQGNEAYTKDDVIHLPALDHSKDLTPEQVRVTRGYVDHEAGHVIHSDMKLYQAEVDKAAKNGDHVLASVINALEDVRTERKTTQQYPGAMANLSATTEVVTKNFIENILPESPDVTNSLWQMSALATTWAGRQQMGYPCPILDEAMDACDPKVQECANRWAEAALACKSTADVIDLAKRVVEEIRKEDEDTPPPSSGNEDGEGDEEGEGQGPGERGSSDSDGNGDNSDDGSQGDEGEGPAEGDTPARGGGHGGENKPIDHEIRLGDTLGHPGGSDEDKKFRVYSRQYDRFWYPGTKMSDHKGTYRDDDAYYIDRYGQMLADPEGRERYEKTITSMKSSISVMSRKLKLALLDKERRDWKGGHDAGRLDSKRLVSGYNGDDRVYKMREDADAINTAVSIIVDHSGSMSGYSTGLARESCIAITEAIVGTGCAVEVTGFNNIGLEPMELKKFRKQRRRQKYSRIVPMDLYFYKDFDESLHQAKKTMGNMTFAGGNNFDSEALWYGYRRLIKRPEPRKIMLVLSDGQPACHTDFGQAHMRQALRNVVDYIGSEGIELIGIGIDDDAVAQYYPKFAVVRNVEDLSKNVIDMMADALIGRKVSVSPELLKVTNKYT